MQTTNTLLKEDLAICKMSNSESNESQVNNSTSNSDKCKLCASPNKENVGIDQENEVRLQELKQEILKTEAEKRNNVEKELDLQVREIVIFRTFHSFLRSFLI